MRLPGVTHRLLIVGRTGSGKSVAGLWHVAQMPIDKMPFVLLDSKDDELIAQIPHAQRVDPDYKFDHKTKPGIYVVRAIPEMDDDKVDAMLWRLHARGGIGFYADEGYSVPSSGGHYGYRSILTQGRSRHIPVITNTQRPVWIDRFARSEADFYRLFTLNSQDDMKTVNDFIPGIDLRKVMTAPANEEPALKQYHSVYRDVAKNQVAILQPCPDGDSTLATFALKLGGRKRFFSFID